MGIYDREYYRREGSSFLGSLASGGQVCKWLILINIVVFIVQLLTENRGIGGGSWLTEGFWLRPQEVRSGEIWRLLTYAFLHDPSNIWHIVFNMLFLWWFGREVEDLYGAREFLAFYLVAAVLGGLAFFGWETYQGGNGACLGASGAVTAVLVLCALHFPTRQILIWFLIPVPIWLFVIFQVAQDTFIFAGGFKSKTAVTVHLAGAAFAFLYYKSHWRILNLWPSARSWQRARSRPPLRVYREETPAPSARNSTAPAGDDQLEARVDAVLEKVAQSGQSSLTEEERQILVRASEVYKRRRT